MTIAVKKMLQKASGLSAIDRAELIEGLFSSFDFPARNKIDALWAQEAEKRVKKYNEGKLKGIPAKKVFEGIQRIK